jgi:hypothetical protein
MVTVYRIDESGAEPVAVECRTPGYPNRDVSGAVMYDNTHYRTLAEAWGAQMEDAEAQVSLAGRSVAQAREALRGAEVEAGQAAERYAEVRRRHQRWKQRAAVAGQASRAPDAET